MELVPYQHKTWSLPALALTLLCAMAVLLTPSTAEAVQKNFCWGKNLGWYPGGDWQCSNGTNRLLTAVYVQADNGNVCAWSTVLESGIMCTSASGTEGVYNNYNLNGTLPGQALMLHFNGYTNHAYGIMWYKE